MFNKCYGNVFHYHCCKKQHLKCTAKARIRLEDGIGNENSVKVIKLEGEPNHEQQEGQIIAEKIERERKTLYESDFKKTPSQIRQKVFNEYKLKYSGKVPSKDRIWSLIVEYLPDDHVLYRALNRHKQECLGNIPRGRYGLDIQKIMEGLLAEGGDKVKYIDSNEMWKDENF